MISWKLTDSSPCIDAGVLVFGINNLRAKGLAPDIGAFESNGTRPRVRSQASNQLPAAAGCDAGVIQFDFLAVTGFTGIGMSVGIRR